MIRGEKMSDQDVQMCFKLWNSLSLRTIPNRRLVHYLYLRFIDWYEMSWIYVSPVILCIWGVKCSLWQKISSVLWPDFESLCILFVLVYVLHRMLQQGNKERKQSGLLLWIRYNKLLGMPHWEWILEKTPPLKMDSSKCPPVKVDSSRSGFWMGTLLSMFCEYESELWI